ncbi:MAG: serine protease [Patescibacteria group bacterium]|nr:serine protease [Patescibacteria group bacterium]
MISLRSAMLMALAASFLTFASQVSVSIMSYYRYAGEREQTEQDFQDKQDLLEGRIRTMEEARIVERDTLDDRLDSLVMRGEGSGTAFDYDSLFPIENVLGSVVEIICLDNVNKDVFYTGSGTVVDKSGFVVTNHHLLVSSDGTLIRFCGIGFTDDMEQPPNTEFIAETVAIQPDQDLAVLQIMEHLEGGEVPDAFTYISMDGALRASRGLKLGDTVFIAGYPGVGAQTFTLTEGVVSGRVGSDLIKTSALVDSGTSGGAAFDIHGNFIGLPTAAARGDIGGSLGYLIVADMVDSFLRDFYAGDLNGSVPYEIDE